jgi:plastocyanin
MRRIVLPALCLALLVPSPAGAAAKTVEVKDNIFEPAGVGLRRGTVTWMRSGSGNPHNVRSDDSLFRSGDPVSGPIDYSVTVSAGTFPYYCEVHGGPGGAGMAGVVRVRPVVRGGPSGPAFTVIWGAKGSDVGNVYDIQYRKGRNGAWKKWFDDVAKIRGMFGKNESPIPKDRIRGVFFFRARSAFAGVGVSDWSPRTRFRA